MQLPITTSDLHDAIDAATEGQDPNAPIALPWLRKVQILANDQPVLHAESEPNAFLNLLGQRSPDVQAPTGSDPSQPMDGSQPDAFTRSLGQGEILPPSSEALPQTPGFNVQPGAPKHTKRDALLKVLLGGLEGGLAAGGTRTAGEGFAAASQLPWIQASRRAQLEAERAQTQHLQAQTDLLKNTVTVRDPYGNTYQVPQGQLAGMLKTNVAEQGKNTRNTENVNSRETIASGKNVFALRKQGLKVDENGNQVPLSYDELSPAEQAAQDLSKARTDATQAQAALTRAKNDPNSPVYKQQMARLNVAVQNARTAAGRLGLSQDEFNANFFGVGPDGQSLPGFSPTGEDGLPVSPKAATSGKVAADRLRKGDLANNTAENIDAVTGIIQRRPDLFGKLYGRATTMSQLLGSNDPDLVEVGQRIHNIALASNGVHGVRGGGQVQATEQQLLNHFRNGQNATMRGLQSLRDSMGTFQDAQNYGNRPAPAPGAPAARVPKANSPSLQSGSIIAIGNKHFRYSGNGATDDLRNYAEVK